MAKHARDGATPRKVLVVDVGGTHVKVLATGRTAVRKARSGTTLTPGRMVDAARRLAADWAYEAVSIGFPGITGRHGPASEPGNLGCGWVGFDFAAAFGRPVKIVNDAAMQALGSFDGGRMLFLGLGTGLGSALIADKTIVTMELSQLPWKGRKVTLGEVLCGRGLDRLGRRKWRHIVATVASDLMKAVLADYVVIGGGNARHLGELPHGVRVGHNLAAFRGGFRLWGLEDVPVLTSDRPEAAPDPPQPNDWRLL